MRTYTIILINCDCASDKIAVLPSRVRKWKFGPCCRLCHKQLGPFDWTSDGTVKANGDLAAIRIYWEDRKKRYETNG